MDHIMVDLGSRVDIKTGTEVILIGKSKTKNLNVESLAKTAGTIAYEIVSRLSLQIPRIYKNPSKV